MLHIRPGGVSSSEGPYNVLYFCQVNLSLIGYSVL
jgi:hypothetical protein